MLARIEQVLDPAQIAQLHAFVERIRTAVNDGDLRGAARAIDVRMDS